jgi:hypothetical protein
MDRHWKAHEMNPLARGGHLQDEVLEDHRVVVAHDTLVPGREHQVQFDAGQFGKGALLLRRLYAEAAIEVGNKVLLQLAVGVRMVGDSVKLQFLRQGALGWCQRRARCGRELAVSGPGFGECPVNVRPD